jgi:hypothetical protein
MASARAVEEGDPLIDRPVTRDDRGRATVPLDEDIVDIAGLPGGELAEAEVVDDEEIRAEPAPRFTREGIVGPRRVQGEEQLGERDVSVRPLLRRHPRPQQACRT